MAAVTIAVASAPAGENRYLVAAWLSATSSRGESRTRGLAEIWVGNPREGLAHIAAEALRTLTAPSSVVVAMRTPDRRNPAPSAEAATAVTRAAERHDVRFVVVPAEGPHDELEAAERFAAARAAGVRAGPPDGVRSGSPPPIAPKLF